MKPLTQRRLIELVGYRERFGNFVFRKPVPPEYKTLSGWCDATRQKYRRGELDADVEKALVAIGFNLNPRAVGTPEDVEARRLLLLQYQKETGKTVPSKADSNPEYAALAQYIQRARRSYHGGMLAKPVEDMLRNAGVSLQLNEQARQAGKKVEYEAFAKNLDRLAACLDDLVRRGLPRDLSYRNQNMSEDYADSYNAVAHLVHKAQHGALPDEHRAQIVLLQFSINGVPIANVLNPAPSFASAEGLRITRAEAAAQRAEQVAAQAIANAAATLSATQSLTRQLTDELQGVADLNRNVRSVAGKKTGLTYLTTDELAVRIKYDTRTIRERLKDRVLKEGLHYVRGMGGRKILWIWERVEATLLGGAAA